MNHEDTKNTKKPKSEVTKAELLRDTKKIIADLESYKANIDHWNATRGPTYGRIEYDMDVDAWIEYQRACLRAIENNIDGPIDFPEAPASCVADFLAHEGIN